jgi:hypothetical protein
LLIGCLLMGQAAGDDAALKAEIGKLVGRLDSNAKAQRDAAEAQLIQLGPRVLDLLPQPGPDMPAEVQQRLSRVRQVLEQAAAGGATGAARVTLRGRLPLARILAEIQRQTGNRMVRAANAQPAEPGGSEPIVTVDFNQTPFWSALDTVLDQVGLTVYPFGQPGAIQVVAAGREQLPCSGRVALVGPLRIEPVRVIARRDLRFSAAPTLRLSLEVAWEPRLRPIGLKQRLADVTAVDPAGQPIPVENPGAVTEAFPSRDSAAEDMDVDLVLLPERPLRQIASLKGTFRAMLPGKVETFRFTDLLAARGVQKRIAAATVTLDEVRRNADTWEVRIRLRLDDPGDAFESHRNWALANEARLERPDGRAIACESSETTERTPSGIGMSYVFRLDKPPADLTFVYKPPGTVVTRDFPYELKAIRLP